MTHAYVDLATIQATDPGDILTAAWCDQVRANEEVLIDPPACMVYNSAAQSCPNGYSTLTANSELYDNDSMHSTVTNTSRVTAQTAGRYDITTTVLFAPNAAGGRTLSYRINGGTDIEISAHPVTSASVNSTLSGLVKLVLAAGDYVEIRAWQNTGGNLNATLQSFGAVLITR
jgi:hypothetical protein